VQAVVGDRELGAGEGAQGVGQAGVVAQPVQRPVGLGHGQQAVGERLQLGPDAAGAVVEQLVQPGVQPGAGAGERPAGVVAHRCWLTGARS
jgi:hypothetical protein